MAEIYDKTTSLWTEDTSPDLQADFVGTGDVSAGGMKRVKLWRFGRGAHGADIASAATLNLDNATGDLVDVTGTTTITAITLADGREQTVRFTGILTLTHGASLVLPGGGNVTTAAGDFAIFRGYAAGVVRCAVYHRAATKPPSPPATAAEMFAAADTEKPLTPDTLGSMWKQGSNIASAATITIGGGGYFHVTGTTTITDIDFTDDKEGRKIWLVFDGILTLTHNASTLILPGGANIITAAGDAACFVSEGSDAVRCVSFRRAATLPQPALSGTFFLANFTDPGSGVASAAMGGAMGVFIFGQVDYTPSTGGDQFQTFEVETAIASSTYNTVQVVGQTTAAADDSAIHAAFGFWVPTGRKWKHTATGSASIAIINGIVL